MGSDDISQYSGKCIPFYICNDNELESNDSNFTFIPQISLNTNYELSYENRERIKNYQRTITKIKEKEDKIDSFINLNFTENFTNYKNNYSNKNAINYFYESDENMSLISKDLLNKNTFIIFDKGNFNDDTKNKIYEVCNEISNIINKNHKKRIKRIRSINPNNMIKNGKKQKYIWKRKDNTDNIKKKILRRFFKNLRININKILKSEGADKFFISLQTEFINKFQKLLNTDKDNYDKTFKEIFSIKFCEENGKKNFEKNKSVLHYLENNKKICEKSIFNIIKKMKFSQMYNEYLNSKEFQKEIWILKDKDKEDDEYIKNYILIALNLLNKN